MTDLDPALVAAAEAEFGRPALAHAVEPMSQDEWADIARTIAPGRRHDVVFAARSPNGRFAVIRKPSYPPRAWRLPGGGAERGESLADAAARELYEETGLVLRPARYVLRSTVDFATDDGRIAWTTHVLCAEAPSESELTEVDAGEAIAERAWVGADELAAAGPLFAATLLAALRHRARVQRRFLELFTAPPAAPAACGGSDPAHAN
jgi:8-oxo-dGTP pyrophosphatase MutT (NUDIX family)